jgi:hypothetical protein
MYRDIRRDWQRWSATERILGLLCAAAVLAVPAALILSHHP